MNLCSKSHDEICFDGRNCPLCAALDELDQVKGALADSVSEARDLSREVRALEAGQP